MEIYQQPRHLAYQMVFQALIWYFLEYQSLLWNTGMCAQAVRLTEAKIKNAKAQEKDYVMGDGDGLQMRIRING